MVVQASPSLDVGKGIDDVDGKDVTVGSRDALEATYPNRLIVNKLLVGLKLWNGMDTSALSSEGVVVVDSDDFTSMGVDNVGAGNERYVGGAVLVISFDVDGQRGMSEDNTHIAASDATIGTAIDHVNAGFNVGETGYTIHDIGVVGLEAHDVVVGNERTNDVTANGDFGSWAGDGAGRWLGKSVG
jgi:hypothetical protein